MKSLAKMAMQDDVHDDAVVFLAYVQADGASTRTLLSYETTVVITTADTTNTLALTLPPVSACKGKIFSILHKTVTGNGATTLSDNGDDAAFSDLTLDESLDHVVLYCDGMRWTDIFNNLSA